MTEYKEKIKLIIFLFISAIGFVTGLNFFKNIDLNTMNAAKGCFEFGLYQVVNGENLFIVFMWIILSTLKYSVFMILGMFSWWLFALVPLNDFSLGFKLGVSVSVIVKILGLNGFFECVFAVVFAIGILIFIAVISQKILNRRMYLAKYNRMDTTDKEFLVKTVMQFLWLAVVVFSFFVMLKIFSSKLFGLTNTFL